MTTGRHLDTSPEPVGDPVDPAATAPRLDDLEALRAAAAFDALVADLRMVAAQHS